MKKPLVIAAVAFSLVLGFLVWWFSDTQVVKRRTVELTENFTIKANHGNAARISKNQSLGELVDEDFTCTIDLENYRGNHRKGELMEGHLYLGQSCESSAVRVGEIDIVSMTGDRAVIRADFSICGIGKACAARMGRRRAYTRFAHAPDSATISGAEHFHSPFVGK